MRKRPQDPEGYPKAMMVSALQEDGLTDAWEAIRTLVSWRKTESIWSRVRAAQARYWFEEDVRRALLAQLGTEQATADLARLGAEVAAGQIRPAAAAQEFMAVLKKTQTGKRGN
jgi:LAO/AO transport system kinase